jgi:hypothetical protein
MSQGLLPTTTAPRIALDEMEVVLEELALATAA